MLPSTLLNNSCNDTGVKFYWILPFLCTKLVIWRGGKLAALVNCLFFTQSYKGLCPGEYRSKVIWGCQWPQMETILVLSNYLNKTDSSSLNFVRQCILNLPFATFWPCTFCPSSGVMFGNIFISCSWGTCTSSIIHIMPDTCVCIWGHINLYRIKTNWEENLWRRLK